MVAVGVGVCPHYNSTIAEKSNVVHVACSTHHSAWMVSGGTE